MGGGGGDDGYERKQAEIEAKKKQAREALNLMFGVAPTGETAPARSSFAQPGRFEPVRDIDGFAQVGQGTTVGDTFDQAGYDAALGAYNSRGSEAEKNKAARDALYAGVRENAFNAGKRRFDESKEKAARDTRFALFAQGLNGGSADIDENALLNRTYTEGLLDLGAKADAAKTDMMSSDEQTRLGLLQSIDAGMDQGSALSSALNQMKVNSDRATASAQGTALGDLFGGAGLLYTKSNAARGRADAGNWWSQNGYQPRSGGRGGSGAASGIITSTGG